MWQSFNILALVWRTSDVMMFAEDVSEAGLRRGPQQIDRVRRAGRQ